jgi:hypothetical protein
MAGRGVTIAEVDEDGQPVETQTRGLYGRLNTHASGKRSGDQFCIYVCDRFVIPSLLADKDKLELLAEGRLNLDELTQAYIQQHYEYRYTPTASGKAASKIEDQVKRGKLGAGRPILNPA